VTRRRPFNNRKVTELLARYKRRKNVRLRNRIIELTLPLIEAAISRKRMFRNREDLRQECALRLLQGLDKYRPVYDNAFAFLWSTICNTLSTQSQKMERGGFSIDSDETAKREAERSMSTLDTPESCHALKMVSIAMEQVLNSNGFDGFHRRPKVCKYILGTIRSGELFQNRGNVVHRLERFGLKKKNAEYYVDHLLVMVRARLLMSRENADAIAVRSTGQILPEKFSE